ncbi:metal ABC transporter solute-binding protein, Zn/Mn family [Vibrio ostreae]|uniref:Zinc ABC transporter substrate-binding protein n=1 Tax=Vibrio ostreae TaxID=2841925 RepID=A0A975YMC4_9VIBR|nr:zinc ABC transporter substrate-binding protein [Vibrio ostreae]QXO16336.1 zinc ABC transporter substrate-binding protein [Vibrio ostreae]
MKVWQAAGCSLLLALSSSAMAKTVDTVASFSVLADIVKQVGGDHVTVTALVGPDGDPHTFVPSPQDSVKLNQADVVFMSGLGLEGWMDRLVTASGYKGPVIVASDGVQSRTMQEDGEVVTDPHAWNSAANGAIYARNVTDALKAADPQDADYFEQRGSDYIEQLTKLDHWAKARFASVSEEGRKVLTSHDAFGYFGAEYGVTFLSPQGFSTESEASAKQVAELISQIKSQHIHAYFIENQTDPRLVKQIAAATGAKAGGELYPEALTAKGGDADTYLEAFKHNVTVMADSMK